MKSLYKNRFTDFSNIIRVSRSDDYVRMINLGAQSVSLTDKRVVFIGKVHGKLSDTKLSNLQLDDQCDVVTGVDSGPIHAYLNECVPPSVSIFLLGTALNPRDKRRFIYPQRVKVVSYTDDILRAKGMVATGSEHIVIVDPGSVSYLEIFAFIANAKRENSVLKFYLA